MGQWLGMRKAPSELGDTSQRVRQIKRHQKQKLSSVHSLPFCITTAVILHLRQTLVSSIFQHELMPTV